MMSGTYNAVTRCLFPVCLMLFTFIYRTQLDPRLSAPQCFHSLCPSPPSSPMISTAIIINILIWCQHSLIHSPDVHAHNLQTQAHIHTHVHMHTECTKALKLELRYVCACVFLDVCGELIALSALFSESNKLSQTPTFYYLNFQVSNFCHFRQEVSVLKCLQLF